MPRNKDLPLLKCDLCPLTTKNHFIFKRHRQRCVRDNGAPRFGVPGQKSKDLYSEWEDVEDSSLVEDGAAAEAEAGLGAEDDGSASPRPRPNPDGRRSVSSSQGSLKTTFTGLRSLPEVAATELSSQGKIISRLRNRSTSDLEAGSSEQSAKKSESSSSRLEMEVQELDDFEQNQETDEKEMAAKSGGDLPPPSVNRNYSCRHCGYTTTKSRDFLYHKIQQHKARIHVFTCVVCEYSSQYKHKLARHMVHAHKVNLSNEEILPENARPAPAGGRAQAKFRSGLRVPKAVKRKKVLSSKATLKSSQSLDSLLVKLRAKAKVSDASLSSFFTSASGQSTEEGGGDSELFKCKLCLFTAKSKIKVIRHLQACHINARLFRCHLCSFKTHSKIEFYAHKKKHTNKNMTMFKCQECSYATEFRPNFDRHMLQHGCNKPNKCSLCSYATDHEGALKRHVTSHHPNTEENQSLVIAGDEAARTGSFNIIGESKTMDAEAEERLETDGFRCPICSLQYRRCGDLNRHMKLKHNVSRKDFVEYNSGDNDEEVFEMDDEFDDEVSIEEVTESEDSDESQPLSELCSKKKAVVKKINKKCSYCSYIAKWPSDMSRHMRVHSMVKRFKCSMCWKKYKYLGDLNVHLRRDHEVNPDQQTPQKVSTIAIKKNSPKLFRCPACPFFTKVKVQMDQHSHKHTEEKTYSCKLCPYQTYWRGDMGRHLYRKHPMEVSKDADLKEFFVYRPERKAISKGGVGVAACGKALESNNVAEEESMVQVEQAAAEKSKPEEGNEDSISETQSVSDTLSNCSEATAFVDKDGNRIYRCQLCTFSNAQAHKIKSHMDTHLNLKQFKCPVCGQRGNWKYDIRKHIHLQHPESRLDVVMLSTEEARATIQEYLATRPSVKRNHHLNVGDSPTIATKPRENLPSPAKPPQQQRKKRAFEYKCSHCPFRSRYRWSVSKHQRSIHAGQAGIGILAKPIGVSAEEEEEEEQTGSVSHDYDTRQASAKPEVPETTTGKLEVDEDGTIYAFRCSECGKQGVSKGSIKKHYNYIHPNSEVRIISVADGVEFNYYTGLPTNVPASSADPATASDPKPLAAERLGYASKLSDPKKHGYSKPFQCSVCGQRSNWKWDVKKHLRAKHPDDFGYVIVLQLDQAQATCPSKYSPVKSADPNTSTSLDSSIPSDKDSSNTSGEGKSFVHPAMPYKSQEMLLGRYRRYKCSGCGYRSNWRTDICRHIERRHRDGSAEVIFMDVEEAKDTFMAYHYNPPNVNPHTPGASLTSSPLKNSAGGSGMAARSPSKPQVLSKSSKKPAPVTGKVWHCPKCPFVSALKSHIVAHMQQHGMKPFHCTECGMTSRFRSPIYRHIRKQHNSTNYNAFAKIVIKFNKPSTQVASPGKGMGASRYIEAFLCRLCTGNTVETATIAEMLKHLLSEHGSTDASQALKIKKKLGADNRAEGDSVSSSGDDSSKGLRAKRYYCTVCPYRTDKRGMLTFHHAYHQPSSQNKFKCKFCPYYVCAPRLLRQHMKWHEDVDEDQPTLDLVSWRVAAEKTPPSSPSKRGKVTLEGTPKKHNCEKCPYTTNSKNDFLYHKQFHRPKPAAEYKCEHCDYWVTHRRLLKQHVRLHGEEYTEDSTISSPTKSLASDASAILDAVEIAAIKQKMIANKITASLSTSPAVSPMKIATQCSVGNRPGFVLRDGMYKKLHQCRKCPYTNIRSRNVRLHELMHGFRKTDHPLMKCPHCDYYVGAKGLLSHHMKVHQHQYRPDPNDSTTFELERHERAPGVSRISAEPDDDNQGSVFASPDIPNKHKVDTLLEISRFKKYSCEKCPYASGKRSHFLRHMELHGSRQRHTCKYCDYSVPSCTLLMQHQRIHLMPNQNLLASQSFSNLQHLKEVPADVALASALPPSDSSEPVTISVIHDHLELYENDDNNSYDAEPKKLYRCDRCPYANVRRDHLLTHLRFHLSKSTFHCPYCDYSAPKQQLLTQHIRVHFCPLPELSDWLIENGQSERAQEVNDIDITQALEVAEKFQKSSKRKLNSLSSAKSKGEEGAKDDEGNEPPAKKLKPDPKENGSKEGSSDPQAQASKTSPVSNGQKTPAEPQPSTSAAADEAEKLAEDKAVEEKNTEESNVYICQYCDREFPTSKPLIAHELQHLIGNHFEFTEDSSSPQPAEEGSTTKATEAEKDPEHVDPRAATTGKKEEVMEIDDPKAEDSSAMEVEESPEKSADKTSKTERNGDSNGTEGGDTKTDAEAKKEDKADEDKDKDDDKGSDKRYMMRRRLEMSANSPANSPAGTDSNADDKKEEQPVSMTSQNGK